MQNHKTLIISIIAFVVLILVCIFVVQGSGNKAITYEEGVQTAKADVDTQLSRRYNVLTELAECVKQYDEHEYQTLLAVIAARGKNMSETEAEEITAQINAVAEAYPDLKSQDNYKQFMTEIATTENLIASYKQAYNNSIKSYNRYCRSFPARVFLGMIGYEVQQYEYYKTDRTDTEPLKLFDGGFRYSSL